MFLASEMPVFCSLIVFRGIARFLGRDQFGRNLVNFLFFFGWWFWFGFWKV